MWLARQPTSLPANGTGSVGSQLDNLVHQRHSCRVVLQRLLVAVGIVDRRADNFGFRSHEQERGTIRHDTERYDTARSGTTASCLCVCVAARDE